MQIIKGSADLNKAIASIANRGKALDASVQLAGVSVLAHASEHGDTTLCDKLVGALPKGSRKLALVEWMLAFGQVAKLDPKNKDDQIRIAGGAMFKLDKSRVFNQADAEAKPWTEFRKEPDVQAAFDAQAAVQSVLKRLAAAGKSGLTIENKALAIADAKALLAALEA